MESTPRWGITLPLRSLPLPGQRDLVAALPDLGYTDAWSSEVNGADAFAPLAVAAQWTTGLRFGTAIAGIYTRGPALLAMDAATCASLAPGRFVLGIGTSSPVIVEDWNGLKLDRPYQRARDTLKFLRPDGVRFSVRQNAGRLSGLFWDRHADGPVWVERGVGGARVAAGTILEVALPFADRRPHLSCDL